jgi:hypothetical protein
VHVEVARMAGHRRGGRGAASPREQGYSGRADWTRIAEVKAAVKIL